MSLCSTAKLQQFSYFLTCITERLRFSAIFWMFFWYRYLYVVPENGKMVLQIGGRHNMDTRVTDVNNNPLTRAYANGSGDANHGAAPDVNQLKWFREHRGLWLLYPDFKRSPREMQVMSTIHSENCNMILHIVSFGSIWYLLKIFY